MSVTVNIILSILSFILALLSIVFVFLVLRQNNKILKQSQEHFVNSKRLENQPFLQMELIEDMSNCTPNYEIIIPSEDDAVEKNYNICRIKNVGNGTATNLIYTWRIGEQSDSDSFPLNAVMKGNEYVFQVTLEKSPDWDSFKCVLLWGYEDILGNTYEQKSILNYKAKRLVCIENDPPTFLGKVGYKLA